MSFKWYFKNLESTDYKKEMEGIMRKRDGMSLWKLIEYTLQMSNVLIHENVSQEKLSKIRDHFNRREYEKVIIGLMETIDLETKIQLDFMPDNFILDELKKMSGYEWALKSASMMGLSFSVFSYKKPAYVLVGDEMPCFRSRIFQEHVTQMRIGESVKFESFESFVTIVMHELMHIVLFSRQHPLRRNELATDIGILLAGYGDIAKLGRIGQSARFGYLNCKEFAFVHRLVELIKFFKRKKKIKNN